MLIVKALSNQDLHEKRNQHIDGLLIVFNLWLGNRQSKSFLCDSKSIEFKNSKEIFLSGEIPF